MVKFLSRTGKQVTGFCLVVMLKLKFLKIVLDVLKQILAFLKYKYTGKWYEVIEV